MASQSDAVFERITSRLSALDLKNRAKDQHVSDVVLSELNDSAINGKVDPLVVLKLLHDAVERENHSLAQALRDHARREQWLHAACKNRPLTFCKTKDLVTKLLLHSIQFGDEGLLADMLQTGVDGAMLTTTMHFEVATQVSQMSIIDFVVQRGQCFPDVLKTFVAESPIPAQSCLCQIILRNLQISDDASLTLLEKRGARQHIKALVTAGLADAAYLKEEPASAALLMTEAIKHHSLLLLEALVKARFSVATPPPIKDGGAPSLRPFELCAALEDKPLGEEMLQVMARHDALGLPSDHGGSNDDASMRLASAMSILSMARSAEGVNHLLETLRQGNPSQRTWVDDSVPQKEQQQLAVMLLNACSGQGPEVDGGGTRERRPWRAVSSATGGWRAKSAWACARDAWLLFFFLFCCSPSPPSWFLLLPLALSLLLSSRTPRCGSWSRRGRPSSACGRSSRRSRGCSTPRRSSAAGAATSGSCASSSSWASPGATRAPSLRISSTWRSGT